MGGPEPLEAARGNPHGRTDRIRAGDTVIVSPGATLAVENPTGHTACSWVTTSIGLEAEPADGTRFMPP